jgi:subtilisin-like proprotein convertase family protein
VTRSFTSTVPIAVPLAITAEGPASPYPSTIPVGGLRAGKILDVNVTLSGVSHTYPEEIEVILVAPNGRTAVGLMSDVGDDHDVTNVTLTFDDQAASYLPFGAQVVSGSYKPTLPGVAPGPDTAALGRFNGLNPNGIWRLYVADNNAGDSGRIDGWALTIKARVRA